MVLENGKKKKDGQINKRVHAPSSISKSKGGHLSLIYKICFCLNIIYKECNFQHSISLDVR